MGPFESQEGITKCWNRLWGLLLYNMSSVRGFTEDVQLNSIREQEICRSIQKNNGKLLFALPSPRALQVMQNVSYEGI